MRVRTCLRSPRKSSSSSDSRLTRQIEFVAFTLHGSGSSFASCAGAGGVLQFIQRGFEALLQLPFSLRQDDRLYSLLLHLLEMSEESYALLLAAAASITLKTIAAIGRGSGGWSAFSARPR